MRYHRPYKVLVQANVRSTVVGIVEFLAQFEHRLDYRVQGFLFIANFAISAVRSKIKAHFALLDRLRIKVYGVGFAQCCCVKAPPGQISVLGSP